MSVLGLVLYWADRRAKHLKNLNHISRLDALLIGCSQALAIIPGVSRSGATMTGGLLLGFTREDAAKFSFLMAIPITFGAGLLKLKEFHTGVTTAELVAGFMASLVFGVIAIKFMLNYLRKSDYRLFVWYRLAVAVVVVAIYFVRAR